MYDKWLRYCLGLDYKFYIIMMNLSFALVIIIFSLDGQFVIWWYYMVLSLRTICQVICSD